MHYRRTRITHRPMPGEVLTKIRVFKPNIFGEWDFRVVGFSWHRWRTRTSHHFVWNSRFGQWEKLSPERGERLHT